MKVRDKKGRRYQLQRELKRGGEGAIRLVQQRPDLVAKIYHRPESRPEAKLAWMVDHPPDDPSATSLNHISIAWPQDLLFRSGQFIGCLMPFVGDAVPLLQVFNPRLRQRTLPGFDWAYLHRTAANLTSVISAVHARGYVIGDLNEGNFLVRPDALVTLLDCDSFQVIAGTGSHRKVFRCPVGKAEYTPPELQGVSYADVDRTTDHDSFGIGVLIFQLLLNGNHPFRSDWRGSGDAPEISVKIKEGLFPHGPAAPNVVAPPDGGPSVYWLHPALQEAMIRCFVDGHRPPHRRPSAEEWEQAIKSAEPALTRCDKQHIYSGHLTACPHCTLRVTGGRAERPVAMMPPPTVPQTTAVVASRASTPVSSPPAPKRSLVGPTIRAVIVGLSRQFWLAVAWAWPRVKTLFNSREKLEWWAYAFFWIIGILFVALTWDGGDDPVRPSNSEIITRTARARATAATKATNTANANAAFTTRISTQTSIVSSSAWFEACQLVSLTDAETIFGRKVTTDSIRSSISCTYYPEPSQSSESEIVVLIVLNHWVHDSSGETNASRYFDTERDSADDVTGFRVIANLGDDAFYIPDRLIVRANRSILSVHGLPLELAEQFLRKAIENL